MWTDTFVCIMVPAPRPQTSGSNVGNPSAVTYSNRDLAILVLVFVTFIVPVAIKLVHSYYPFYDRAKMEWFLLQVAFKRSIDILPRSNLTTVRKPIYAPFARSRLCRLTHLNHLDLLAPANSDVGFP